ncbi:MAG: tetratricopeptide repeat protein [Pyrinomonadaceae bacterium]|nr:tetratricopeptide repeat protein [Blastocatellia bacterium]MCW5955195.1 tetratricopeptide repeat protein [Pyrinomonadaceae bacterium]
MKRCPQCARDYNDDSMSFCLDDGSELLFGPVTARGASDEPQTAILSEPGAIAAGFRGGEEQTRAFVNTTDQTAILRTGAEAEPAGSLDDATERQSLSAHRAAKPLIAAVIAVVVLVGAFLGYRYLGSGGSGAINSIAVMPFVNDSGNADIEYLSDGMTETLIGSLTQVPNLNVKARSSVFRYKGKDTDARTIGKELGVQAILTGRVAQRGDQLTLSLELVDTQTENAIWSQQYSRKQNDLVTLQSELARDVSTRLKSKLSGADAAKVEKKYTEDPEAYQLYLKGRYYWNKRTEENLNKAIEQFKAAADTDPNFALAYAGLADCYGVLPDYSNAPSTEFATQAKAYAERAISLDDSLGESHISLALAHTMLWDWNAAGKEFERGLELSPNYATGYKWYGGYLLTVGRYDRSLTVLKKAQELEPLSFVIYINLADSYLAKGDAESAIEQCKRAIELDATWYYAYLDLALAYLKKGSQEDALAAAEKGVELSNRARSPLSVLGYVLARTGKRGEALQIADELKARFAKRQARGFEIATIYLGLDDRDEAFRWLEKDFENREAIAPSYLSGYPLNNLSDDPRYKDLLKRMNLPE